MAKTRAGPGVLLAMAARSVEIDELMMSSS